MRTYTSKECSAMNSHYNRLAPDFAKCGGKTSLGHSLQTMVMPKRESKNSVRKRHYDLVYLAKTS